jgi:acetyl esterase
MALDPQAHAFLAGMEASGAPPLYALAPDEARGATAMITELIGPGPQNVSVEDFTIATSAGRIGARRYVPEEAAAATIVWIHGGGWVICDLETHDALCRLLAVSSGCQVIALDYRRAPEHPFPAPLEDCWDALRAVAEQTGEAPLILAGDSAGGNMAAACTLRARDLGGPDLALQVLICPVVDHDMTTPSYRERGSGPDLFVTAKDMEWFWNHYLPDPALRSVPDASPLRAEDLSDLPPAIVITAEYDPLRDEGIAYAQRLQAAGVPVTHRHHEDMFHDFFAFVNLIDASNAAVEQVGAEIRTLASTLRPASALTRRMRRRASQRSPV